MVLIDDVLDEAMASTNVGHLIRLASHLIFFSSHSGYRPWANCPLWISAVAEFLLALIEITIIENKKSEAAHTKSIILWFKQVTLCMSIMDEAHELRVDTDAELGKQFSLFMTLGNEFRLIAVTGIGVAPNRAEPRTKEVVAKAEKEGLDVKLRLQMLPRGTQTVVERWREDVNAVVETILQVSNLGSCCGRGHENTRAHLAQDNNTNETREQEVCLPAILLNISALTSHRQECKIRISCWRRMPKPGG